MRHNDWSYFSTDPVDLYVQYNINTTVKPVFLSKNKQNKNNNNKKTVGEGGEGILGVDSKTRP